MPQRPKGKLVLKYFDIAGRAEPIRLALTLGKCAGVPFSAKLLKL